MEPFVRRRWPQMLISWTRLLSGDWRDPLVARDALVGCAFGVLTCSLINYSSYLPLRLFAGLNRPPAFKFESVIGARFIVSMLFTELLSNAILTGLFIICLLVIMRLLLRNQKVAIAACIIIVAAMLGPSRGGFVVSTILSVLLFFLLMRFGLIATTFYMFTYRCIFINHPITLQASAWYSGYGYFVIAIFMAIVLYAFCYSLGGRPLISAPHLDD